MADAKLTCLLLAVGLVACGEPNDPDTDSWQPDPLVAVVTPMETPATLAFVSGLAVGPDGSVYLADFQGGVSAFGPDGTHRYDIGRPGEGPGDLRMPCCLAIGDDGQLWVADLGNQRYSVFTVSDTGATFLRTLPSGGSGWMSTDRLQRYGSAGIHHLTTVQSGERIGNLMVVTLDSLGTMLAVDTVPPPNPAPTLLKVVHETGGGVSTNQMAAPFTASPLLAFGPGFYASASSGAYRVEILPYGGGQSLMVERQVQPVPVSTREADSARAAVDEWLVGVGGSQADIQLPPMTMKPSLRALGIDQDGRVWVQRSVPDGAPNVADVYSADGAYLDSRQWPADIQLVSWAVTGYWGVGVRALADDEQVLVRLEFPDQR